MIGFSGNLRIKPKGFVAEAHCDHDWRYFEDPEREYTGYLERCSKCGAITQVPQ